MSIAFLYNLSTVCRYVTLYRPLVLFLSAHCCLLQSVQCLSVFHKVPSLDFVSLSPLLFSTTCPQNVSTIFRLSTDYLLPCGSNTIRCFTETACTIATDVSPFKFSDLSCNEKEDFLSFVAEFYW